MASLDSSLRKRGAVLRCLEVQPRACGWAVSWVACIATNGLDILAVLGICNLRLSSLLKEK